MNERIRKLALDSGLINYIDNETPRRYFISGDGLPDCEKVQRFARLIVRECSKIIVNGGYWNPAFGEKRSLTPPEIAMMIKDYFGVEE
jgi:hypothetical protein